MGKVMQRWIPGSPSPHLTPSELPVLSEKKNRMIPIYRKEKRSSMIKRITAFMLVLVLLVGMVPSAFAEETIAEETLIEEPIPEETSETLPATEETISGEIPESEESTLPDAPERTPSMMALESTQKNIISDLAAGTYYVKELGHSDKTINARYTCTSTNPQKISVTGGSSTSVSFHNKLSMGSLKLIKKTNTGNQLEGWVFRIKDSSGKVLGEYTTDKTGCIEIDKNNGTSTITDGYAHTGTASAGDTIEYQIISTLPAITSQSSYLTTYTFADTLSKGLTYAKGDVALEFFSDSGCTRSVAKWTEADGKFSAAYNSAEAGETMSIEMTQSGLAEINTSKAVYAEANMVNSGYSGLTLRITYTAKVDSDSSLVIGDAGNPNNVTLTWKHTSTEYYDTLQDDCHVYTYGMDLTKKFSDGKGSFANVEFVLRNETDSYYVKAELNKDEGVYYVTGHVKDKGDATHFIPVTSGGSSGKVIIKGLEDDVYHLAEVRTDNGYTLLKKDIEITISQTETDPLCADGGQNAEQHLLTASAKVDGKPVTMLADRDSANAEAQLSVVNTHGFDLPKTGDNGTMMFTIIGILLMAAAAAVLYFATHGKSE